MPYVPKQMYQPPISQRAPQQNKNLFKYPIEHFGLEGIISRIYDTKISYGDIIGPINREDFFSRVSDVLNAIPFEVLMHFLAGVLPYAYEINKKGLKYILDGQKARHEKAAGSHCVYAVYLVNRSGMPPSVHESKILSDMILYCCEPDKPDLAKRVDDKIKETPSFRELIVAKDDSDNSATDSLKYGYNLLGKTLAYRTLQAESLESHINSNLCYIGPARDIITKMLEFALKLAYFIHHDNRWAIRKYPLYVGVVEDDAAIARLVLSTICSDKYRFGCDFGCHQPVRN